MPEQHLGILTHNCSCKGITLVRTQIMAFIPPATNQLFEVVTRVDGFIVRGKVIEDFG